MLTTTLVAPGWKVDPATNAPIADLFPGTLRALLAGRLHSRVPATILIAIGAFLASSVIFLFAGFLVSVEAFSQVRVPFTRIVVLRRRAEPVPAGESQSST